MKQEEQRDKDFKELDSLDDKTSRLILNYLIGMRYKNDDFKNDLTKSIEMDKNTMIIKDSLGNTIIQC